MYIHVHKRRYTCRWEFANHKKRYTCSLWLLFTYLLTENSSQDRLSVEVLLCIGAFCLKFNNKDFSLKPKVCKFFTFYKILLFKFIIFSQFFLVMKTLFLFIGIYTQHTPGVYISYIYLPQKTENEIIFIISNWPILWSLTL